MGLALGILGLWAAVLLVWLLGARRAPRARSHAAAPPPTSVVIAARNPGPQLTDLLHDLAQQTHPQLEIIVVNDRSSDGTADLLRQTASPPLTVVTIAETPAGWTGKKWALTQGIAAARYDTLLFTDADCRVGPQWAVQMTAPLHPDSPCAPELALGLSPISPEPAAINHLQRYQNRWFAAQLMAAAGMHRPVLALGRNLAYRRTLFDRAGGFASHAHRLSGDDDLLVVAHAPPERTVVIDAPQAQATTAGQPSLLAYVRQRRRHISTAGQYPLVVRSAFALWGLLELAYVPCLVLALQPLGVWAVLPFVVLLAAVGMLRLLPTVATSPFPARRSNLFAEIFRLFLLELGHWLMTLLLAFSVPIPPQRWH